MLAKLDEKLIELMNHNILAPTIIILDWVKWH